MKKDIGRILEIGTGDFRAIFKRVPNQVRMGVHFLRDWLEWQKNNGFNYTISKCFDLDIEIDSKNPDCLELEYVKRKEIEKNYGIGKMITKKIHPLPPMEMDTIEYYNSESPPIPITPSQPATAYTTYINSVQPN